MTVIDLTSDDVSGFKKSDFDMIKTQINGLDTNISIGALFNSITTDLTNFKNNTYKLNNERAIQNGANMIAVSDQKLIDLFTIAKGINNTLLVPWNISLATYTRSHNVSGQEYAPYSVAFSYDGLKMYVTGNSPAAIIQYSLNTAWDVSTLTFTRSFDVSGQESYPYDVTFSSDGTEMYVVGDNTNAVNQYSLSTAWNIDTASFTHSFSVSSQETSPEGVTFSPDGTEMYVIGYSSKSVNQYSLSTGWDVSTATFIRSFDVSGNDSSPWDVSFSSDGTEMYILGRNSKTVYQYTLNTAWDISSATLTRSFSVSGQESYPGGLAFSTNGSEMYIVGDGSQSVHQYSLNSGDTDAIYDSNNQYWKCKNNVGTNYDNSIIQSTTTTISTGNSKVFITPLLYEELATGDSITADISLDGGTTYTTNIPINTWSDITSTDGTSLIAKLNLNTGDGTTTPKVEGWSVLLE